MDGLPLRRRTPVPAAGGDVLPTEEEVLAALVEIVRAARLGVEA
jgi:hypothetical protein